MEQTAKQAQDSARSMIKAVHDDGFAEINGRQYDFTKMVHKERRKVFAFYTRIQAELQAQSMWFLESEEFKSVEAIIESRVLYNGQSLSKLGNHWELYPEDYILLVQTALGVISYPFLPAPAMSSASQEGQAPATTSKKPMSM